MALTLGQLPNNERQANAASEYRSDATGSTPRLGLTLAPANEVGGGGNQGVAITAVDPTTFAKSSPPCRKPERTRC
jgi:serine protease Do